jgi:hypothetical protein
VFWCCGRQEFVAGHETGTIKRGAVNFVVAPRPLENCPINPDRNGSHHLETSQHTMKTKVLLAVAGLAAGLITAAFSQDEVTPEIRQQIEALNQKLDEAINNHDPAGCAACCIATGGGSNRDPAEAGRPPAIFSPAAELFITSLRLARAGLFARSLNNSETDINAQRNTALSARSGKPGIESNPRN